MWVCAPVIGWEVSPARFPRKNAATPPSLHRFPAASPIERSPVLPDPSRTATTLSGDVEHCVAQPATRPMRRLVRSGMRAAAGRERRRWYQSLISS